MGSLVLILAVLALAWLPPESARAAGHESGKVQEASRPNYMELEPLIVPVIRNARLHGQITFIVVLELAPGTDRNSVFKDMPRLRDALFRDLKLYAERHRDILRYIKLKPVKALLLRRSVAVLGDGSVDQVLVQGAMVHRF